MMNTTLRIFLSVFALAVITTFTSCNKDDGEEFGTISFDDGKAKLQENGIAFINELEKLKESNSIDAMESFADLVESSEPGTGRVASKFSIPAFMSNFIKFKSGEITFDQYSKSLRTTEDPETLSELWENLKGTYTWNAEFETWDEEQGGDKIIFHFPAPATNASNNATITFHKYVGVEIKNQSTKDDLEYDGDLPGELLVDLVLDGEKEMEYSLNITYNNDDLPNSINTHLFVNPFTLSYEYSQSSTNISSGYSLKANDANILSYSIQLQGNLTYDNIFNSEDFDDLDLGSGSLHLQVMQVKLEVTVNNLENVIKESNDIYAEEGNPGFSYEDAVVQLDNLYNSNSTILAYFTDTNQKIADAQFKHVIYNDDFWDYQYIDMTIELVFSDGSKVSFGDYIESGFETLEAEYEALVEDI